MKVYYVADDGVEFDNEAECLEYERLQNEEVEKCIEGIHAFDLNFKEIKIVDYKKESDIQNMIDSAIYLSFDTFDAYHYFNEMQEYFGYTLISKSITSFKEKDVYSYEQYGMWVSVSDKIKEYQTIIDLVRGKESWKQEEQD